MSEPAQTDRVLTIPNVISFLRIALIPVFVALIVDPDTRRAGLVVFVVVVATDWVDGALARATGQVSDLGKVLDPVADRLAIAAGLIALVVADAFPLWAALLILVRDVTVLIAPIQEGTAEQYSAENGWQLRRRVRKKLDRFLDSDL